ncbi:MAG: hypothetical protein J5726_08160 [Treponema sp.]|nr:hypothetical protein [Treponema sp.]
MKNKFFCFIYMCLLALLVTGCATKPTAQENEAAAPKSEPRVLTVINNDDQNEPEDLTAQLELAEQTELTDQSEPEEEAVTTPAHTFVTEIKTEDGTTYIINIADIAQRINFAKLSADNYDLNYQAVLPLSLSFWGRELPKAGDTVIVNFTGTSTQSIPAPVFAGLLGNGFGVQMEFWDNLVSFDDDENNYVLFAQDIEALQVFTASATFKVYEDCQNNIALHLAYPFKSDTQACIWQVSQ